MFVGRRRAASGAIGAGRPCLTLLAPLPPPPAPLQVLLSPSRCARDACKPLLRPPRTFPLRALQPTRGGPGSASQPHSAPPRSPDAPARPPPPAPRPTGCNRSFAELWRLKVHYRAPPDVRGSGKERGHGTELAFCPKCGKDLRPGKHHVGCAAGKSAPRQAAKRQRQVRLGAPAPPSGQRLLAARAIAHFLLHCSHLCSLTRVCAAGAHTVFCGAPAPGARVGVVPPRARPAPPTAPPSPTPPLPRCSSR